MIAIATCLCFLAQLTFAMPSLGSLDGRSVDGHATVTIHAERSTSAKLEATITAFDETHNLSLTKVKLPKFRISTIVVNPNGSFNITNSSDSQAEAETYEDLTTGAVMMMHSNGSLQGIFADSMSIRHDGSQYVATKMDMTNLHELCGTKSVSPPNVNITPIVDDFSTRQSFVQPEISVFVDTTMSNYWGNNLVAYLSIYWNSVNKIMRNLQTVNVNLRIVDVYTFTSDAGILLFDNNGKVKAAYTLDNFGDLLNYWIVNYNLPRFDLAYYITGREMLQYKDAVQPFGVLGVAYTGGVCQRQGSRYINTGIVSDNLRFSGAFVTGHELGHSLGADHDGSGSSSGCSTSDGYIMGNGFSMLKPSRGSYFSPCSNANIAATLGLSYTSCLRQVQSGSTVSLSSYYPGQYFDMNEQCRTLLKDPAATVYQGVADDIHCVNLHCLFTVGGQSYYQTTYIPALEGSRCPRGGYCNNARCTN